MVNKHSVRVAASDAILKLQTKHVTNDLDLSIADLSNLLSLSGDVKRNPSRYMGALAGRYLSLLFEKPSLRTRLTFELAMQQLGGSSILNTGPVGDREPIKDVARNLDRWTNGIVARTFSQKTVDELARWSGVPVINALSDLYHPCQALADVFTLQEHFGELRGLKVAFLGDGNNVAHSLMLTATRLGASVAVATPAGYGPNAEISGRALALAEASRSSLTITNDPREALRGADAVYTDVWASMGQESQKAQRMKDFAAFQVTGQLLALAKPSAVFMHCLPARRGEEVTDEVIESLRSVVFDQAENRLHTQKALLLMLLA